MSPVPSDFQQSMTAVDEATTKVGTNAAVLGTAVTGVSDRFNALKDQIKTGMTADEVETVQSAIDASTGKLNTVASALQDTATFLNSVGVEATNPVPNPVPAEPVL
jgi:hypothetical protein